MAKVYLSKKTKSYLRTVTKRIIATSLLCTVLLSITLIGTGFSNEQAALSPEITTYESFRDIPGITDAEIAAIENLQARGAPLIYASFRSTELFERYDGTLGGFTVLFCDWLSNLFGIEFMPVMQGLSDMLENLETGEIDFATMSDTPQRRENFFVAGPIAQRSAVMLQAEGSEPLGSISQYRLPRYVFMENSIMTDLAIGAIEPGSYETVFVPDEESAYHALADGTADVFISTNNMEAAFDHLGGGIYAEDFLPLYFLPAAMIAGNPVFEPVISLVNKALNAGAYNYMMELYRQGYQDYKASKFVSLLTDEERAYIRDNPVIPIAVQNMNYPWSFYNEREDKWDGIASDVMEELHQITGLDFEIVHNRTPGTLEIFALLENGEAFFIPYLTQSNERRERFLFSQYTDRSDRYALLSKRSYPDINLNDIPFSRVGIAMDSTSAELYRQWFEDALYTTEYPNTDEAIAALERGDIDLVMSRQSRLAAIVNYLELSDYKANFVFSAPHEISFAFDKNNAILCSIIDKALPLIGTVRITEDWMSRTYNFENVELREQRRTLVTAFSIILIALVFVIVFIYRNRKMTVEREVLRDSQARTSILLDTTPLSVSLADKDFRAIFVNEETMRMFDISSKEEYHARIFKDLTPAYQPDGSLSEEKGFENMREAFKNGYARFEWLHKRSDGELMPCEITMVRVDYKDDYMLAVYARDLREEKAAMEKLRKSEEERRLLEISAMQEHEANQLKSRFLATISHEIRTPMNAILGMTELAIRESSPEAKDEHLHTVGQAASNLLGIVNDILDFSKIEAGKLDIVSEEYFVESLINDLVSIIRMRVVDSHLRFIIKVDSHIPRTLIGDETRIHQAVLNILSNAVKYTMEGHVMFSVYMSEAPLRQDGEQKSEINLIFEVTDTGIGINPKDIDKLFSDFTQLDYDRNKGIEGIGLGLSITRNIVDAMGGEIYVSSEYGKGSTFTIALPQKYTSDEPLAKIDNPEQMNVLALIYERRSVYTDSFTYTLNNLGINHAFVTNLDELREQLKKSKYDFLMLPYELHRQDEETIQELKGDAKIIILSEFGEIIPRSGMEVLPMPVCCTHIANVLNGIPAGNPYAAADSSIVKFTAPDAKVLVVDDIKTNLAVAEGLLAPYNMDVDLVSSGLAAIEAVQSERYDLVFMDHKMPGLDGVETTQRIRASGEAELPIVALTANAVSGMRDMFFENGFNDFLSKPIDTAKLGRILEKWIPKEKQEHNSP